MLVEDQHQILAMRTRSQDERESLTIITHLCPADGTDGDETAPSPLHYFDDRFY